MSVETLESIPTLRELLPADQCDRCVASAFSVFRNKHDQELFFCAHHTVKYVTPLSAAGFKQYEGSLHDRP